MNATKFAAVVPSLPSQGSVKDALAYLALLGEGPSSASMHSALDQVARILTGDEETDSLQIPWNQLRYEHMAALRSHLAEAYSPATVNNMLVVPYRMRDRKDKHGA